MSRLTSIIIIICFSVWLFPLGAYIQPAEEAKVCNGRRAICLCTQMMAQRFNNHILAKTQLYRGGGVDQQKNSSPSFTPSFVLAEKFNLPSPIAENFRVETPYHYKFKATRIIEHVPKAV